MLNALTRALLLIAHEHSCHHTLLHLAEPPRSTHRPQPRDAPTAPSRMASSKQMPPWTSAAANSCPCSSPIKPLLPWLPQPRLSTHCCDPSLRHNGSTHRFTLSISYTHHAALAHPPDPISETARPQQDPGPHPQIPARQLGAALGTDGAVAPGACHAGSKRQAYGPSRLIPPRRTSNAPGCAR